ncbi:Piso0_001554 [Millerozyma farinosa CBS 7064]|uniref:Piso0_001554 protein n=1 Tax=Pichia sorbitophila (strain ATCC MYA-4447 / BCRC 22081 / CBS 7064 / NBRC 10061 / NRRL Y-12695) TaxID=559304 RepID=G8YL40_PICSO|nr:Piso0_001554 [Millerozyma farinosa CBS 7064]
MVATVKVLRPGTNEPSLDPIAIKLNGVLLRHFQECLKRNIRPKLVVKDGQFSLRISDGLEFPCSLAQDRSNVDVYTGSGDCFTHCGSLSTSLGVITDPKQIKEHQRELSQRQHRKQEHESQDTQNSGRDQGVSLDTGAVLNPSPLRNFDSKNAPHHVRSTPSSPMNLSAFAVSIKDSKQEVVAKFLALVSLGPITKEAISESTQIRGSDLDDMIHNYLQIYKDNDTFISEDRYPVFPELDRAQTYYVLKDKSYKELSPWKFSGYTNKQRSMIINNIHNALTRLGYSETHPLRRKICDEAEATSTNTTKKSILGGGFLVSKKSKIPYKKALTESPRLSASTTHERSNTPMSASSSINRSSSSVGSNSSIFSPVGDAKTEVKANQPTASTAGHTTKRKQNSASDKDKSTKKRKLPKETSSSPKSLNLNEPSSEITSSKADTQPANEEDTSIKSKRFQYYSSLAGKFKQKYREYEDLYHSLQTGPKNSPGSKKELMKLFELHNTLSEWKRKLWDFDNETKHKFDVMTLSKHKKNASDPSVPVYEKSQPPCKSKQDENFTSSSISSSRWERSSPMTMNPTPRLSLNY